MPGVNVSTDALTKVKSALNNYGIDITGFSAKLEQQSFDISKAAEIEIKKNTRQIEDTVNTINQLTSKTTRLAEDINHMDNEAKSDEQKIVAIQNHLATKQVEIDKLKKQVAELEKYAAKMEGAAREQIQSQINQLKTQISQIESEIRNLRNEISKTKEHISQLQRKTQDAKSEKAIKEDESHKEEKHLDRLNSKQERMKAAFIKINENMEVILYASNTEQNVGNIDKCIAAIDAYLAQTT